MLDSLQRRRVNTSPEDGHGDEIDSSDFHGVVTEGGIVSEPVAGTTPVDEITVVISPSYSENERDIVVEVSDADAEGEGSRIIGARPDICYKNFTAPNVHHLYGWLCWLGNPRGASGWSRFEGGAGKKPVRLNFENRPCRPFRGTFAEGRCTLVGFRNPTSVQLENATVGLSKRW